MDIELRDKIIEWAKSYNTKEFIPNDPVQFPHRFEKKQDIEISGFLTAWISYGKRSLILKKANELHQLMNNQPYSFILHGPESFQEIKEKANLQGSRNTFYRFYTYQDLLSLCERLNQIYSQYESLEEALINTPIGEKLHPIQRIQFLFKDIKGIPTIKGTSACKRLAMFLRWMVRQDGIVDFGIWKDLMKPSELIIPLDTHVHHVSETIGLIPHKTASWKTAVEITEALKEIFPDDPCLGDFALFGYGEDGNES